FDIEGPLTDEHLHGRDRNVTRQIAAWAVSRRNQDQHQLFQGLTYRSSYGGRRCWAIWRDTELKEVERRPIQVEDPPLREVAEAYGLTVRWAERQAGVRGVVRSSPPAWPVAGYCHLLHPEETAAHVLPAAPEVVIMGVLKGQKHRVSAP